MLYHITAFELSILGLQSMSSRGSSANRAIPPSTSQTPKWGTYHVGSDGEPVEAYGDGGLCPVHLGDVVAGMDLESQTSRSFTIITKLGHGAYSTVWLAKELTNASTGAKYIALKCLGEEHSTTDNTELQVLQRLGKLRAAFFYKPPDSSRVCLLLGMDPVGATLHGRNEYPQIACPETISSVTSFVKTLVSKVLVLHGLGITHGDISHNNVVLGVHPNAFTPESLKHTAEEDNLKEVVLLFSESQPPRPPNYPKYIIYHHTPLMTDKEDMSKLDLIDFGSAFFGPSKAGLHGTRYFAAPELSNSGLASTKSDLWSLGCVILYGLTGYQIFDAFDLSPSNYVEADGGTRRLFIEHHLAKNACLYTHPELGLLVADIVHCLMQPDPSQRDPAKARKFLQQLETSDFVCLLEENNSKDGKRCHVHWDTPVEAKVEPFDYRCLEFLGP